MERKNRLAVFEHVPPKKQSTPNKIGLKCKKRTKSPEPSFDDNVGKRRKRQISISEEHLLYKCECENCKFSTNKYYGFLNHLIQHVDDREYTNELELDLNCNWANCDFVGENMNYLTVHLTHHGYHMRLKEIGSNLLNFTKLPECNEINNNKFHNLPEFYICEWDYCNTTLRSYQFFIDHVKCHVNALPKKCSENDAVIQCRWTGCSNMYAYQQKLFDHIKCHTKEKVIACPTCEVMFSTRTKFYDHRKRQLSEELQGYKCSQCLKLFASERLLRDHMRIHIHHYKCNLCDMTCTKPSSLAKHIRYRHLPDRLYKCDICGHSTVTKQDLAFHRETHSNELKLKCLICGYQCRSKHAIDKHIKKHEGNWDRRYACHCCERRFIRGAYLTKHLIKVHDFHWPSGHSRFSYKQDTKTGLFHLQVVRYESLEVTQEMMEGNVPYQFQNVENCTFECVQSENKPLSFILRMNDNILNSNQDLEAENKSETNQSTDDVLITIEEVDSKGNIVKVETLEHSKIIYTTDLN